MAHMEQYGSAPKEAGSLERINLTAQEVAQYNNACEELARSGWVRRNDEGAAAFAERTLKHVNEDSMSPENKVLNPAVEEYDVFEKIAEMQQMNKADEAQREETKEAMEAIPRVTDDFAEAGWIKPEQLKGLSPQEQAKLLLDTFEKNGGRNPGYDNGQFLDPKEEAMLRALVNGRLGR